MHDSISANDVRSAPADGAPANDARATTTTVLDSFSGYAELRATATTRGRRHVLEVVEKQRELLAWLARELLVAPDAASMGDVHENSARLKILELLASTVDVQEALQFLPVVREYDDAAAE